MSAETEVASGANLSKGGRREPATSPPSPLRQRRILWLVVLAWTALVSLALWWLFSGGDGLSVWVFQERDVDQAGFKEKVDAIFRYDLGLQRTYPWILFGPYLALMAWYFPLEREGLRRNLPLNLAGCLAFVWACHVIGLRTELMRPNLVVVGPDSTRAPGPPGTNPFPITPTPGNFAGSEAPIQFRPLPGDFRRPPSRKAMLRSTVLDLLAYGAVTGLGHSVNFYRRLRERERRALFLEAKLANARLNTLKAQLQPHFLFNSLNAITTLLRRDPRLAETTLVALSELLRLTLRQSERQEGSLREEWEVVQRYLEIQQTRFGDKLQVEVDIEAQTLDCRVPTLVLQPLVENAIRHGIEPAEKAGVVRVSAGRKDGKLILTVEDDGVGLPYSQAGPLGAENPEELRPGLPGPAQGPTTSVATGRAGTGIGLANLRERLQALYGAGQKLELRPRPTGGVIARVEIPWQPPGASEITGPSDV